MAGLSKKLSRLVEATDDPVIPFYTYTHLGIGAPNHPFDRGFRSRLENARNQVFLAWYQKHGPLGQFLRVQKEMDREHMRQLKEQQRELQETALLNAQEQQMAVHLFQQSSLRQAVRYLSVSKTEELRSAVANRDPLARLLVIQTIGARRLHLEPELIERLNDPDLVVRDASRTALVRVARGTDFGPIPAASQRTIARSIEKWKQWLALQQNASPEALAKEAAIAAARKQARVPPLEIVPLILVGDEQSTLPLPKAPQGKQK